MQTLLLENCVDPDQTPHYVASDLGLHCLLLTLLRVSVEEWVNTQITAYLENGTYAYINESLFINICHISAHVLYEVHKNILS